MTTRALFLVILLCGCGDVTAAPPPADDAGGQPPAGGAGGAAGTTGAAGTSAGGTGGTAPCTPATVALTAGPALCDCSGTCGACPVADAPTCGGTGLGHSNWFGCTVGGAPYAGCAQAPDGGALGYCCRNNCSIALCEP